MTSNHESSDGSIHEVQVFVETTIDNVERVIVGKRPMIELVVIALLCKGHVLIEDAPGTGKTPLPYLIQFSRNFQRLCERLTMPQTQT